MRTWLLSFLLALGLCGSAGAEEARLVVLHTTDLHGSLTAYDYPSDRSAARGLVKLASMVDAIRREGSPTLLLDNGDCIAGSAIETYFHQDEGARPEPMMTAMNRMGYDVMAVGNHEFSFGPAARERARATARFPWLAANVVGAGDGRAAFERSLVKTVGPLRVGIVGVVTPAVPFLEDSANFAGLEFGSPVEAARREAERLRGEQHCDVVVILAHTGLEPEGAAGDTAAGEENWGRRIARAVPEADLVILGHTHAVVPWVRVGGVLLTQAGSAGEHLGRVDVTLSRDAEGDPWKRTSARAHVLSVDGSTPDDSSLASFAEPYHRAAQEALSRVIGRAARDLESPRGRFADGAIWDLVQRAQLEASGADVSLAALFDPDARIARGPVTVRDALRIYPYDNALAVIELTGGELKQALEHSARYLASYTFAADRPLSEAEIAGFNFDAAEGVDYRIDLTRPLGDRVVELRFRGKPLEAERRLKVAVNSYRLNGGGGFETIRTAPRLVGIERPIRDLLVEHIRRAGVLDGATSNNWGLLPDYAAAPERPSIDLLVRQGVLRREEAYQLRPDDAALRADLAGWLARAFGWRTPARQGAFGAVADSLRPWLGGLLEHHVLASAKPSELQAQAAARLPIALDWCERAARAAGFALRAQRDSAFRDGLLTGLAGSLAAAARLDTLTRSQALGIVANARFPTLRVLETTDFHGAILSTARDFRSDRPLGGSAVLAAYIERLRAENPRGTVLLDGGDCFQGTMISNLQFGSPVTEQMNALHYAAMAIGNHEFDWSADTLENRVHEMHFAALGANLRERDTGRLPAWARPDTVFTRRGVRVGVLGLCYRYTPSVTLAKHVAHLRFEDDSATAVERVPGLRARSDVVLAVGHVPASSDSAYQARGGDLVRLARGVPGVDAWFGGHSHNRVLDRVAGVPVMIAGAHGQVVGVCDLVVDPVARRVVESRTELVTTFADAVTPDSAMAARVERWNASIADLAARPVGRSARRLTRGGGGESAVGDLVSDAIRDAVHTDVAFQNSGGLRADLPEGTVTRGKIYEVMPFDNVIITMDLTGAEIRRALTQGLNRRRVTQVSGLRYGFDLDRPEGERLIWVRLADGAALQDDRLYSVACNDFMATRGDNYDVLSGGQNRVDTGILVRDVLESFVAERSRGGAGLDYQVDGRIERASDRGSTDGD